MDGVFEVNPFASIRELATGLRKKDFSSVELTEMYLGRLETLGREYNAVAEVTRDLAIQQARRADLRPGTNPLHGVPFGAKDLLATKGIPTRWGSPGHHDQVFDYDATSIKKLYERGAVLIGKLAMIELAGGGNYNVPGASATGACACAWDKKRWAGGSSSGSGAATALGCVAYSLGSETSGSITCPSAFNGLTGFRPTYGRVSRHGAMALCWTLDKIGPMCRSAEDCRIVMEAIAGHDPLDASSLPDRLNLGRRNSKPVIGLLREDFAGNNAAACEKGYQEVLAIFRKLGYETVEVEYPKMPYDAAVQIIVDCEGASAHEHFIRGDRFQMLADVHQVAGFATALETRAVDYLWAMRLRTEALKANEIWSKCDALFTPVFYHPGPAIDQPFDKTWVNMGGDSGPSNLLGWPSMCFPMAWEDGAPIGGQIMAPCLREDRCYQVVAAIQRESDWHKRVTSYE